MGTLSPTRGQQLSALSSSVLNLVFSCGPRDVRCRLLSEPCVVVVIATKDQKVWYLTSFFVSFVVL